MSDSDDVLERIDKILGYGEDMTIEWDHSTSSDAMRSRPAATKPPVTPRDILRAPPPGYHILPTIPWFMSAFAADAWQTELIARIYDIPIDMLRGDT